VSDPLIDIDNLFCRSERDRLLNRTADPAAERAALNVYRSKIGSQALTCRFRHEQAVGISWAPDRHTPASRLPKSYPSPVLSRPNPCTTHDADYARDRTSTHAQKNHR
jgi:hypothetical protein